METIEVRYKPILDGTAYHKYLIYTDSDGDQWIARGGPENGDGYDDRGHTDYSLPATFGRVVTEIVPYDLLDSNTPDRDLENDDPREVLLQGPDLSSYWDTISDEAVSIHNFEFQYQPMGQNSNAVIDDLLDKAGLPPTTLDDTLNSPGSDVSFLTYYPYTWDKVVPFWIQEISGLFDDAHTASPLVLDLDGNGIELAALNNTGSVFWDIDLDGIAEDTGWITGGDGLLAIDLNADGQINDHSELFGDQTGSANGFLALAAYDSNADNAITNADAQWSDLLVWVDTNANGYSEAAELHSLDSLGITSINLAYSNVSYFISGNEIKQESTFTINGQTRDIVDAWFAYDDVNTEYRDDYTLDVRTLFLPTLRGFGNLPDLHIAMSQDETLLSMVQDLATSSKETLFSSAFDLNTKLTDILFRWAGVENVSPSSRGIRVDGQKLEFVEELVGEEWVWNGSPDPETVAGELLEEAFEVAFSNFAMGLLVQTDAKDSVDPLATYNYQTGLVENADVADVVKFIGEMATGERGSSDDDLFFYFADDGSFILKDLGGTDKLILDSALSFDDVRFWKDGDNLEIYNGAEKLVLDDQFNSLYDYQLETIVFADGTEASLLNNLTFTGTAGADSIYGLADSDDIIVGSSGNDSLRADTGDDTYVYNLGDGTDTIKDLGGTDSLLLGQGITQQDIRFWNNNDNLELHIGGDRIVLDDQFNSSYSYQIETAVLSDGTVIDLLNNLTFTGTAGLDYIFGTAGGDTLNGLDGADRIYARAGDDVLVGGLGSDRLFGEDGYDTAHFTGAYADYTITDNGSYLSVQDNVGTDGTDRLYTMEAIHFVDGVYDISTGIFTPLSSVGTSNAETINGDAGDNTINGLAGDDTILGGDGNDTLLGGAGDDTLKGWDDQDTLYGGEGNDFLYGENDTDFLYGDAGADTINGGPGNDEIYGGEGNDTLLGGGGHDTIYGGDGDDTIDGVSGNDALWGEAGNDTIYGGTGSEVIMGGADNDTIYGNKGNDYLHGEEGNDTIYGNVGRDFLYGEEGADILYGGGADGKDDRFIFEDVKAFQGVDTIKDFAVGEDKIDISDVLDGYFTAGVDNLADFVSLTDDGTHTTVAIDQNGGGDSYSDVAVVENVIWASITAFQADTIL